MNTNNTCNSSNDNNNQNKPFLDEITHLVGNLMKQGDSVQDIDTLQSLVGIINNSDQDIENEIIVSHLISTMKESLEKCSSLNILLATSQIAFNKILNNQHFKVLVRPYLQSLFMVLGTRKGCLEAWYYQHRIKKRRLIVSIKSGLNMLSERDREIIKGTAHALIQYPYPYKSSDMGITLLEMLMQWYGKSFLDLILEKINSESFRTEYLFKWTLLIFSLPTEFPTIPDYQAILDDVILNSNSKLEYTIEGDENQEDLVVPAYQRKLLYCKHIASFHRVFGYQFIDKIIKTEIIMKYNVNPIEMGLLKTLHQFLEELILSSQDNEQKQQYQKYYMGLIHRFYWVNGYMAYILFKRFNVNYFQGNEVEDLFTKLLDKLLYPALENGNVEMVSIIDAYLPMYIAPLFSILNNLNNDLALRSKLLDKLKQAYPEKKSFGVGKIHKSKHNQLIMELAFNLYDGMNETDKSNNQFIFWIGFIHFSNILSFDLKEKTLDEFKRILEVYSKEFKLDAFDLFNKSMYSLFSGIKIFKIDKELKFIMYLISNHINEESKVKLYNYIRCHQFILSHIKHLTVELVLPIIKTSEVLEKNKTKLAKGMLIHQLFDNIVRSIKEQPSTSQLLLNILDRGQGVIQEDLDLYYPPSQQLVAMQNLLEYAIIPKLTYFSNYFGLLFHYKKSISKTYTFASMVPPITGIDLKLQFANGIKKIYWAYQTRNRSIMDISSLKTDIYRVVLGEIIKWCDYSTLKHYIHNYTMDCIETPGFKELFQSLPSNLKTSIERESRIFNNITLNNWLDQNNYNQLKVYSNEKKTSNGDGNNSEINVFNIYILKKILVMIFNDKATNRVWRIRTLPLVCKRFFEFSSQMLNQTTNRRMFTVSSGQISNSNYSLLQKDEIKTLVMQRNALQPKSFDNVEQFEFSGSSQHSSVPKFTNLKRIRWVILNYLPDTYNLLAITKNNPLEEAFFLFEVTPYSNTANAAKLVEDILNQHPTTIKKIHIRAPFNGELYKAVTEIFERKKLPISSMLTMDITQTYFSIVKHHYHSYFQSMTYSKYLSTCVYWSVESFETVLSNYTKNIEKVSIEYNGDYKCNKLNSTYFQFIQRLESIRTLRINFSENTFNIDDLIELIVSTTNKPFNIHKLKLSYKHFSASAQHAKDIPTQEYNMASMFKSLFSICSRPLNPVNITKIQIQFEGDQSTPFFYRLDPNDYAKFIPINDNHTLFIKEEKDI